MKPRQGDEREGDLGHLNLEMFQPGLRRCWSRVRHLVGELEPGQRAGRRGEEGVGEGGCKPESVGVRGRGRPFSRNFRGSCYSVRRVGTEWDGRPRGASRAIAPSSQHLQASAVPPLSALTPCSGAALRPKACLLW